MSLEKLPNVETGDAASVNVLSMIGLGYVGLPAATMFALSGLSVIGVDVDTSIVDKVNRGDCPITEPGLAEALSAAVGNGLLSATTAVPRADAFVIAVPTPLHCDTCRPDISFVEAAAMSLAPVLKQTDLVILESTSPVGTTRRLMEIIVSLRPDLRSKENERETIIDLAYSPERILPGKTMTEIVINDRVIGGVTGRAARRAEALYKRFVKGRCMLTDDRTAEMVKLTENTFRDVNIALANELSIICDKSGVDVWEVIRIANCHPRVSILSPGPGVGGHCISVDPWFLATNYPRVSRLIRTAREVNEAKPLHVVEQVRRAVQRVGRAPRIACFGLSYKANTDDFRESPALHITETLAAEYPQRVVAVEPFVDALRERRRSDLEFPVVSADAALSQCDVAVMLVGHRQFAEMRRPVGCEIVDAIGLWRTEANP